MTLVVAHRGDSGNAPENTLVAFKQALGIGVDGMEMDVHSTKDKNIVVMHDGAVDRTTNGTGSIGDKTLAEIKALDAGSSRGPQFAGEKVPTLDEALTLIKDQTVAVIELKHEGIEQPVADIIRKHNSTDQTVIITFLPKALKKFREVAPEISGGLLTGKVEGGIDATLRMVLECNAQILDIYYPAITPELVAKAHLRGISVWAWTVDEPADIKRLIDMGVDGITSNHPRRVKEALAEERGGKK